MLNPPYSGDAETMNTLFALIVALLMLSTASASAEEAA